MPFASILSRASAALLLCAASVPVLPAAAGAAPPKFIIRNSSGLTEGQAKFYYLGAGEDTNGKFIVLMPDGTWATAGSRETGWNPNGWNPNANSGKGAATGAGVVPCYQVKGGEAVTIPFSAKSMRLYVFMARKGTSFYDTACNTPPAATGDKRVRGIFNTVFKAGDPANNFAPFSYSLLTGNGGYAGPSLVKLKNGKFPHWAYAEIGLGDIDTSQVDAISFPLNVTARMTASPGTTHPVWNEGVGFSFSNQGQVNMNAVVASYKAFVATLPTRLLPPPNSISPRAIYGRLLVGSPIGAFLTNPGNYLGFINQNEPVFANLYRGLVNDYLWNDWSGTINVGGDIGLLTQKIFAGTTVTLKSYSGYAGKAPLKAIKFTGGGVSAYVLSPATYQLLCKAGAIPGACGYMTPAYQIFATDGALNTPIDDKQFALLTPAEKKAWAPYATVVGGKSDGGLATYNKTVARLGFIMSMALNHGVAGGLQSKGGLCGDKTKYPLVSACWSDQTLWYPVPDGKADARYFRSDKTQNEFARWLHTAQIGKAPARIPMMTRPNNPTTTASGIMGMGYGFAADENPTPPFNLATMSQTPSEYSSNVAMVDSKGCNYITIMPVVPGKSNPTPVEKTCAPPP